MADGSWRHTRNVHLTKRSTAAKARGGAKRGGLCLAKANATGMGVGELAQLVLAWVEMIRSIDWLRVRVLHVDGIDVGAGMSVRADATVRLLRAAEVGE